MLSSLPAASAETYLDIISKLPSHNNINTYMKGFKKIYERVQ